jgi:DNA repair exonuclease SbcCD ATPase subunit
MERQRRANERKQIQLEEEEKQQQEKTNNVEEIDEVLDIYKKAIASIKNSQAINEETLKVAEGIGQKLAAQTEQMLTIQSKLDQLGDGLGRARHEMNTFLKGLATEKVKKKIYSHTSRSLLSLLFVLLSFC